MACSASAMDSSGVAGNRIFVLVQRELEVCLLSVSVISGTTMLSYHVVALTGWPSSAA